jgi:multiple sugar transport system substrate-binding protein
MTSLQLSLQYHTGRDAEQLHERLANFRRTYRRIELPITVWPWDAAWDNLARVALYKDGADVSEIGTTWLGSFVGMDAIRPFTAQELSRMGGAETFLPASWQNGSLLGDQNQWGIPWLADTRVIFYWRDMLDGAGIDEATAFHSVEQMPETLARLQANGLPTPWVVTTRHTHSTLYNIASWIWGAGGDFVTADGAHIALDEPAARRGLLAYFDLQRFMPRSAEPLESRQTIELFRTRQVAALIHGPWFLKNLREQGGSADIMSRIGVALPPGPSFVGGSVLAIWKHIQRDQESAAVDLIRSLVTDTGRLDFYIQTGNLPARLDLLAQPVFANDTHFRVMIQSLQQGRTHARLAMWGLIEDRLMKALAQIWSDIRAHPDRDKAGLISYYISPLARRLEATLTGGAAARL